MKPVQQIYIQYSTYQLRTYNDQHQVLALVLDTKEWLSVNKQQFAKFKFDNFKEYLSLETIGNDFLDLPTRIFRFSFLH